MPEFETILNFLVLFGGFMGVIVAVGFGFKKLVRSPRLTRSCGLASAMRRPGWRKWRSGSTSPNACWRTLGSGIWCGHRHDV